MNIAPHKHVWPIDAAFLPTTHPTLYLTAAPTSSWVVSIHMNKKRAETMRVCVSVRVLKSFPPSDARHGCVGLQTGEWQLSQSFDLICSGIQECIFGEIAALAFYFLPLSHKLYINFKAEGGTTHNIMEIKCRVFIQPQSV